MLPESDMHRPEDKFSPSSRTLLAQYLISGSHAGKNMHHAGWKKKSNTEEALKIKKKIFQKPKKK